MSATTKNRRKIAAIALVTALIVIGLAGLLYSLNSIVLNTEAFKPHYLSYGGSDSRIFLAQASTAHSTADRDYVTSDGQRVPEGSKLFVITLAIRNDYSNTNPPPAIGTPVAPIDGTAYICLSVNLYDKHGVASAINVSPSDFSAPPSQTGLILASGQTNTVKILLATNNTEVSSFLVNLVSLSDSVAG
jgi:hypothetical protein